MVGNKIVVVGGRTGHQQLVTQTEVYDGTSWQEAADIPVPGDHLAAASDGTYLYAVGGRRFGARQHARHCSATTRRPTSGPRCRTCRKPSAAPVPRSSTAD